MKKLSGMTGFFAASVTPYDGEGRVAPETLIKLMNRNLDEGAAGFLIGGSSAECALLSREEKELLLRTAAAHPRRKEMKLIGACSSVSQEEAIGLAKLCASSGCDAAITTAPYYYKFGMKALSLYLSRIREAADIPLFFYNFPGNTGVEIDLRDPDIRRVLTDGTVSGVKHTSLNLSQMERMRDLNPELVIFGGYDEVYLGARILGADGAIGSTFNFTLPLFKKIEAAYEKRDLEEALALQHRANRIMEALVRSGLFPSIKHMLRVLGLDCGDCRAPFMKLTEEQMAAVESAVRENL